MILLRDANRLALTKLRIRLIRLFFTVIISSLLFTISVFIMLVVNGALKSVDRFNTEGLSNRYLVEGFSQFNFNAYNNPEIIKKVEKAFDTYVKEKEAEAKRLGLEYSSRNEIPWTSNIGSSEKMITNLYEPRVKKIIDENLNTDDKVSYTAFQKYALDNGAIKTYKISGPASRLTNYSEQSIKVIKDNKETFDHLKNISFSFNEPKGFATIEKSRIRALDESLIQPFILPGQSTNIDDGSIPALVPYSVAEEALNLKALTGDVKPNEKLSRIKEVREKIAGQKLQVCYRNANSIQSIKNVIEQNKEIELNKGKKDYVMPKLLYDYPKDLCGATVVKSDKRTSEEKKLAAKQKEFDSKFSDTQELSKLHTIRIIGIVPDENYQLNISVQSIFSSILGSSVGGGWITTLKTAENPNFSGVIDDINTFTNQSVQYVAELPDNMTQKNFLNNLSCYSFFNQTPFNSDIATTDETIKLCEKNGKYYNFQAYGNNTAAIDQFRTNFNRIFNITLLALTIVAAVILLGIIARIISDSRRETAVFRSIGATKIDISAIYFFYTVYISTIIVTIALSLGLISAYIFNHYYSGNITADALLIFNSSDLTKKFIFVGSDNFRMLLIVFAIYCAGILGLFLPLFSNLRRNILRDMRDEN